MIGEQFQGSLALSFLTAVALFAVWWQVSRAEALVERWCRHTGFDLLRRSFCWTPWSAFPLAILHGQWVYRITIRTRGGQVRQGYVCVGSALLGVLVDEVDVRWDR